MNREIRSPAVLLHLRRYSESSLITEWWTRDHGLLHTIARGALRPRQPSFPGLDVLQSGEINARLNTRSRLHTLTEFSPIRCHPEIAADYPRFLAAAYAFELIRHYVEPESPIPELYDLLTRFLDFLSTHPVQPPHITRLEQRFFSLLGWGDRPDDHQLHPRKLPAYLALQKSFPDRG